MTILNHSQEAEQFGAKVGASVAYAGGGVSVAFGLTQSQWQAIGIIVGIAVGVLGLAMNWYFKSREDKRQQAYWDDKRKGA